MLIHRVKVQECASAAITEVEYKHCLNRIREYVGPLSESASYQMLCSSSKPPAMIQKQETFERKMRRNLFGLYEISVWINEKRFNFIIDSGAQISGIRRRCLEQLHLQTIQGKLEIGSVGAKKMMLEAVMASSVDIGGISWQHVPLVILEQQQFSMPFFHHDLLRFDGILGWDLLSQIDFEMDTIAGRFKVFPNRFRLDHPNLLSCSFPAVLVRNEKNEVSLFGIDSGAKQSWLGEAYVREKGLQIVSEAKVIGFGVHGKEEMQTPIIDSLILRLDRASIELRGSITAFVEIFPGCPFDGIFGNEIFAGRRIRFVNSRKTVLLR